MIEQPKEREKLLTAKEVADWLGVSEKWNDDHIERRSPKIPAKRLGGAVRFKASEIDAWLDKIAA